MCCSLYDDDMFLQMEWHVLSTLSWAIGHPTVDNFLLMSLKDTVYDPEVESMALYILEIALYHRDFVSKRSSVLAAAALALSRHLLNRPEARYPDFADTFDHTIFVDLSSKLHEPSQILSRKYASVRYSCVSRVLTQILAHRAAMAQAPPTPVYNVTPPVNKSDNLTYFPQTYSTPQKAPVPSVAQHGLYTPPVTPEEEMFGATSKTFSASHYAPPTPTPNSASQYHQFTFRPQNPVQPQCNPWTIKSY